MFRHDKLWLDHSPPESQEKVILESDLCKLKPHTINDSSAKDNFQVNDFMSHEEAATAGYFRFNERKTIRTMCLLILLSIDCC